MILRRGGGIRRIERIAADVSDLIGGGDATLVIDESGFSKKGVKSAGVARQWKARLGKVDNCQVGVFAALTDGIQSALVDKLHAIDDLGKRYVADVRCNQRVYTEEPQLRLPEPKRAKGRQAGVSALLSACLRTHIREPSEIIPRAQVIRC